MTERIWILGAQDPEMEAVEGLLREAGERIIYALGPDGQRARGDAAYRIAALSEPVPAGATVYRVECDGPAIPSDAIVIDHHRPGDPGYGRPPEEFLPASSLGQVIAELARLGKLQNWERFPESSLLLGEIADGCVGIGLVPMFDVYPPERLTEFCKPTDTCWAVARIPDEYVLAAAADHCLAAAYRGECPGVDPDALMRWRVESRAKFQRRPVDEVLSDVERARAALRSAPELTLADQITARDMRGIQTPELPEASARENVCFVADGLPGPDGRVKVVCQSGTPAQIEAFMRVWAPEHGLTDIYGDPARGFAGGYASR